MNFLKLSNGDNALLIRLLKTDLLTYGRLYAKAIVSMVILALSTAASAWIMRNFINNLFNLHHFSQILYVSLAILLIFIVKGLATYFQILYLERAGNRIVADKQRDIYNKLCQQSLEYFQINSSATLLTQITNSANQTRAILDLLITTYIRDLISLASLVSVMVYSNVYLSIVGLIVGPSVYFVVSKGLRRIRQISANEIGFFGQITTVVQETVQGIKVIKAFSLEDTMRDKMNLAITNVETCANKIAKLRAATSPIMETLAGFSIALICVISGYLSLSKGTTPGDLMAFITALLMAYEPAKRLANSNVSLNFNIIGLRLLFSILDAPIELKEKQNTIPIPNNNDNKWAVEFKKVKFSYPSLPNKTILHNINLQIPKKGTTALVGASGAGKSTIINLLLRFYDPNSGSITINGVNVKDVSFKDLHQHVAYVGQDTFLFQDTIKCNIGLGTQNANLKEIMKAAKIANAHEFIMQLPQQYDTLLGPGGVDLSGGQKQRIALSRAILRKSPILILDEATSALDSVSEKLIAETIEKIAYDCTIIAIAHRFSTIKNADNILVFDHGKIVQQGSLKKLLNEKNGIFKRFYDLQFTTSQNEL